MFRIRLLTFCTTPRGPVRADHLREPALAAVAVADGGPRCDLLDRVRRNVDDLKTARGRELLAQDVIEQADALDFYPRGRLERSIDELEAEKGNARHFLAVRPRVRSTARHDGEEDSQCCLHGGGAFPQPGIPGTAPPAKQMGHYVGRLIAARVAGGPPLPPFIATWAISPPSAAAPRW